MPEPLAIFSPRQLALIRQVSSRLLDGWSEREIAADLGTSTSFVSGCVRLMRDELNL